MHIVRDALPVRAPRPSRTTNASYPLALTPQTPRLTLASLSGAPSDDNPNQPPQIVIVQNPQPSSSSNAPVEFKGIPKLPLPEQWLHKRPIDYKYTTIPRPLAQISTDLGADLTQESRAKKFSATRSPSLEKDEKSPFVTSAKSDKVFGFESEVVNKLNDTEMTDRSMMSPKEDVQDSSPSNLRRFKSVSTKLNMCSVNESHIESQQERLEMQNSPSIMECGSAKSGSKFDFSPKMLADSLSSPRFFTPPEMVSPMFFTEPSPKSVYYDTVRSPKFFPETPRDMETPQSPRTLGDYVNRNGLAEKPSSPKLLSAKPSPKIHSYNKENYFTFEQPCLDESVKICRPKKYGGRNSIEREKFTPPADKEIRRYRRHNSCDTNYKTVELNITNDNKQIEDKIDTDVVDCCAKIDDMHIGDKAEQISNELQVHTSPSNTAQARRQRLKSISLDSDNAKIIEQNLGLPIAKQMKDQMNEAYKNQEVSTSCESMERHLKTPLIERPMFKFETEVKDKCDEEQKSPDIKKKTLRQSSDAQSFVDMPRFSPKEFEITVTSEEGTTTPAEAHTKRKGKNLRNLTIDLTKRDSDLEKELLEFEKLYTDAEEKKVKTPTLKVKATSLDSSETVNLSLPQKTLNIPQNSVSVPNTPKRQIKRILAQKSVKHDFTGCKMGFNSIQSGAEQRRLFMKGQDSGIYLRENHASLMLYQPGTSRMGSRTMGSFDENMADFAENAPEINISGADNRYHLDAGQALGSNLLNYKQNLSVSSTNLKTLPEGVPSDDFEPTVEDEKVVKKLHRRNSNQSLMLSTHSLQGSNCSLNNAGVSCHNLATVRTSISNFSLNTDRQKRLSLDRRDSNTSLITADHLTPTTRVLCTSNSNVSGEVSKNCLLQRRGSNNSLTLNILSSNNLSRHSSNSSLNKDIKPNQKKGLLERRSSNTSLTLNINTSNPQLSTNRGLSISNYNLNGSTSNLSRYNSNHSIDNEPRKGILERRSSNTSLTLNIHPQEPRDIEPRDLEIDESVLESNLKDLPHRDKHRKSLSTENLIPKSYKCRTRLRSTEKCIGFGSHDNLWSTSYTEQDYPQNLTYVCGDQENEIIYAFGRQDDPNFQVGFVRNITTKPLSPQSTSEDFRLYLANMQHLQNASSVLSRQQLRDLNEVFQNGYSKVQCHNMSDGQHCCSGRVEDLSKDNPQMAIPDPVISQPCSEYQKMLLRNLHQEFWDMPTNFQEKPIVSGSHPKNRYKTILPNEHSRFILKSDGNSEGYINANFIKVSFLCIYSYSN